MRRDRAQIAGQAGQRRRRVASSGGVVDDRVEVDERVVAGGVLVGGGRLLGLVGRADRRVARRSSRCRASGRCPCPPCSPSRSALWPAAGWRRSAPRRVHAALPIAWPSGAGDARGTSVKHRAVGLGDQVGRLAADHRDVVVQASRGRSRSSSARRHRLPSGSCAR